MLGERLDIDMDRVHIIVDYPNAIILQPSIFLYKQEIQFLPRDETNENSYPIFTEYEHWNGRSIVRCNG